eukprot:4593966-Amphidinium_carterae.2
MARVGGRAPSHLLELLQSGNIQEAELQEALRTALQGTVDPLNDVSRTEVHIRDSDLWTPLHWAAYRGHANLAASLLRAQASVNSIDNCGATPLMIASFNGYESVVQVLLEAPSIEVNRRNKYDSTAMHYAAQHGHAPSLSMLVKSSAEVHAVDKSGNCPLAFAAKYGHIDAVRAVLEARGDPEQANNSSQDSIELARVGGHSLVAAWLE